MEIDHVKQVCEHEPCRCEVEGGQPYCSEYCRNAAEFTDEPEDPEDRVGCGCGHAACDRG